MNIPEAREHDLLRYHPAGAVLADRLVTAVLGGTRPDPGGAEPLIRQAATDWLGQLLAVTAGAAGADPALLDFGDGRGALLARQLMTDGRVFVSCDHCEGLLLAALAYGTAALLARLHGDQAPWQWQQLTAAIVPGFPGPAPLPA